jgi:hypothetical protein
MDKKKTDVPSQAIEHDGNEHALRFYAQGKDGAQVKSEIFFWEEIELD